MDAGFFHQKRQDREPPPELRQTDGVLTHDLLSI